VSRTNNYFEPTTHFCWFVGVPFWSDHFVPDSQEQNKAKEPINFHRICPVSLMHILLKSNF